MRAVHCSTVRPVRAAALFAAAAMFLAFADQAIAQETRAEIIRREQAEKLQAVRPPELNAAEKIVNRLEDWGLLTGEPRGVYPVFDSVYPGGGFAAGLGARKPFRDNGAINVMGAYSVNSFWRAQTDVSLPSFASNRGRVSLTGGYLDAPDVKYYGIGQDSNKTDKTFFGYTPFGGGGRLDFALTGNLSVGGGVNYIDIKTDLGCDRPVNRGTLLTSRYTGPRSRPATNTSTAGRGRSSTGGGSWATRGRADCIASSSMISAKRTTSSYSFRSLEAEVTQLIPLLRANWVVALRGLTTITDVDDTKAIPYFLLPSLGGGTTVRGFDDFRFRDRNRVVMNAELRWTPARIFDMAVFYDTGKVTARKGDLDFRDLEDSYGIGMRIIGLKGYVFRVEVAHSREHSARLLFSAGGAF